ncbi:hypothetical protein RHMOL_Rhmol10G0164400 [Rhododendron molle]|uniref:Uncharacterized protein n=1 Tax=Rhododendron molle TaxID=49168 RepID=A0ACC0M402_RHOML|nr:hypothetical protein RHMOL_Rhmol10G0164400 [Rhododendron molle]
MSLSIHHNAKKISMKAPLEGAEGMRQLYAVMEMQECWISSKAVKIISSLLDSDKDCHILCSSGNIIPVNYAQQQDASQRENSSGKSTAADGCFVLRYQEWRDLGLIFHKCTVCLSDVDFHCYPNIVRLLVEFSDKLLHYGTSLNVENPVSRSMNGENMSPIQSFGFTRFGFSNFSETGSSEWASIPLDCFPFVTIYNCGSLSNAQSSFIHSLPDWRKILKVRDRRTKSPKVSLRGSAMSFASELKRGFGNDMLSTAQYSDVSDVLIDLSLSRIRVHFHDCSCIVGTVVIPTAKSSVSIRGDCLDVLCSTEGLTLCSSWWPRSIHDFLWGPSSTNFSPILNVKLRKQKDGPLRSELEISFGIQHVSCILPPDFLAILIGYFSLPDWCSKGNGQFSGEIAGLVDSVDTSLITYKFEDLSLSLFLLNNDGFDASMVDPNNGQVCITFITPFSADVWVRIPDEKGSSCVSSFASTCVMARVDNVQLIAKDGHIVLGFEALLDIIDQFSSVDRQSEGFTSDVLQFLQFKRSVMENRASQPEASTVTLIETKCCVNALSISFYHSRSDVVSMELVARADMQFLLSASFKNEIPIFLDVSFHSLTLFSHLNSVMLGECTSSCPTSSVLDIHLSMSDQGENDLLVSLPSLAIWLHLVDWTEVIDLLSSYSGRLAKNSIVGVSPNNSLVGQVDQIENATVNVPASTSICVASENMMQTATTLAAKLENIGIEIHIPVWISREAFSIFGEPQVQEKGCHNDSCNMDEGVHNNFITVSFRNGSSELLFSSRTAKIMLNLAKINGTVGLSRGKSFPSWPFCQFSQVNVEAEIRGNQLDLAHVIANIQCESLDLWLSYHIFFFWKSMAFKFPKARSGQSASSSGDLSIKLRKISILLTDGRWNSKGPLMEVLMRNFLWHANMVENKLEGSVAGDLRVNYNNIHKVVYLVTNDPCVLVFTEYCLLRVLWEPFIEPWNFELNFSRLHAKSALLSNAIMTDFHLTSTAQLNLNVTVSLVEAIFRATEMVKDAWGLMGHKSISESQSLLSPQICENMNTGRYAPYILQNLTSLPLVFQVCQGSIYADYVDMLFKGGTLVHPGSSVPIYVNDDETPEELLLCSRPAHSSDRLGDKQVSGVAHHYIVIQFNGTSVPSTPISMDLVGLNHFEVDFSKSTDKMEVDKNREYSKSNKHTDEVIQTDSKGGFVVPVVCDVSVQRYCKLIRLYSTVILCNATSMPFEVRFDIPFGVSPKILDPILPGREFPLPLHLAEAGRVRWRPLDQNYLWSEAHNISNILLQETKIGPFRSFVCYPSHPSSDPFRCCISVQQMCFPPTGNLERSSSRPNNSTPKPSIENCGQVSCNLDKSKKRFIHQVTLCCPLIVRNYLPQSISLTIESGGVARTALLSKVETSFCHIDSSHDLGIVLCMHGFKPSILKFPRAETFSGITKFSGTKYSISETVTFEPDLTDGPVYVTVEKVMDAFSGAREIFIFMPYLLYNCTGFSLIVSDCTTDMKGHGCIIPSCYDMCEEDLLLGRKDGLGLLSTPQCLQVESATDDGLRNSSSLVSTRKIMDPQTKMLFRKPRISGSSIMSQESSDRHDLDAHEAAVNSLNKRWCSSIQSHLECSNLAETECKKVEPCMYSPDPSSSVTETMVRLSRYMPQCATEKTPKYCWSSPFFLVQPTGSTNVVIPQLSGDAAYIISVTSSAVDGPFSGRTRAITFQPRYVLSNACSKDLCYKQKGTDSIFHLATKQHSHLQWTETTRELLVSVRFNEPGWQWSGCFLADHLGDTQVKMRNYVSGAVNMIRVEVQNADISIQEEKIVGSVNGNSGTNLILLSDDDTGFMPYRIDNFSKERIRVYQQRCESFETLIQSYTSCSYAWDEPFYPHRLTVEVPGERVVGSCTLDDVKEYAPIYLPSTSEKPVRTLLVSVHTEGAIKELLFACAKNTRINLLQSLDQQKFSFQISSFQIDNQLPSTPYPVILCFDREYRSNPVGQTRTRDDHIKSESENLVQFTSDSLYEPAFWLAAAKWRNRDVSLASFEYISLRLADFHLELEQEVILGLFDFFRTVSSRSRVGLLTFGHSTSHPVTSDLGFINESPSCTEAHVQPKGVPSNPTNGTQTLQNCISCPLLPSVVPIGAPWQQIFLLARRQKKVYVEMFDVAPIKLTLSFSSTPWTLRNGVLTSGESLIHRGLMALADVEGAQIYLRQLFIAHHIASWESIQEIIIRHYTRQLLHETYKERAKSLDTDDLSQGTCTESVCISHPGGGFLHANGSVDLFGSPCCRCWISDPTLIFWKYFFAGFGGASVVRGFSAAGWCVAVGERCWVVGGCSSVGCLRCCSCFSPPLLLLLYAGFLAEGGDVDGVRVVAVVDVHRPAVAVHCSALVAAAAI